LPNNNLEPSRKRLNNVWKEINQDEDLKKDYEERVMNQLNCGIVERAPVQPARERLIYMPHKPEMKENATATKVRMVFDASMKPHPMANRVDECMFTGPPLQPLLLDITVRARLPIQHRFGRYSEGISASWY
jgi:hypothetical protein